MSITRFLTPLAALAIATSIAGAQAATPPKAAAMKHDATHETSPWKEMNTFHSILAATYHPASDAGNLKPLREKAADLAAKAREWAASTPPAPCASDTVRTTVGAISLDAVAVANSVLANATDEVLTKEIKALHDKFEGAKKGCGAAAMKHH